MEEINIDGGSFNNEHLSVTLKPEQTIRVKADALKLSVFDWLWDLPEAVKSSDLVEVQFKNTRKGYFVNSNHVPIVKGDIVAVESSPGHDIGIVTLMGDLVKRQIRKNNIDMNRYEVKRVYRVAKSTDLEKWERAKTREHKTMIRAREIAKNLNLDMKIGDVEFQGDGNKAIFYYIADGRVDFRQLIKHFADEFRVRIEMKQIGARQEAGRIGGIGPCGRQLCCSSWMSKFTSVSTTSARYQELSLNPQKLAGQCGKLKCCLNYEIDSYVEAQGKLPNTNIPLETEIGTFYHQKTDVHKALLTYSASTKSGMSMVTIPAERVSEIIILNRKGIRPRKLEKEVSKEIETKELGYQNVVGQDDLKRFDRSKGENRNRNKRRPNRNRNNNRDNQPRDNNNA
jgi:cell fate regulator YaaT (PSP1 superfamily)